MKKSVAYKLAIMAVIDADAIDTAIKVPVLEQLIGDKQLAEYTESREEKEAQEGENK